MMRKALILLLALLPSPVLGQAFSTMPYVFVTGQNYNPSQLNADFQAIVNQGNSVGAFLSAQIAVVTPPPSTTILFFHLSSCPAGWTNLGGSYAGRFVRGHDEGRGIDPLPQPIGQFEAATLQDHTHTFTAATGIGSTLNSTNPGTGTLLAGLVNSATTATNNGVGAVNGAARHGATTRGSNIALFLCQKD